MCLGNTGGTLLSAGSTQKDLSQHFWNIVDWVVANQNKITKKDRIISAKSAITFKWLNAQSLFLFSYIINHIQVIYLVVFNHIQMTVL